MKWPSAIRLRIGAAALLTLLVATGPGAASASASGPPVIGATWASAVLSSSARVSAEIDPGELPTSYHFEYITEAAYQANLAAGHDGFSGTLRAPSGADANLTPGGPPSVTALLFNLTPGTTYRYRAVARNSASLPDYVEGTVHFFVTESLGGGPLLPDGRGWEMVSPVQKNGGEVDPPGAIAAGGVLQAAAAGGAVTYGSSASFAGGGGAPPASQYLAIRTAGGWSAENLTEPLVSGSYDTADEGVPYQLFSSDLARSLLLNGDHCRGEGTGCAVANPPLPGTDAPEGYQNYYLRESGAYTALLGAANAGFLAIEPSSFDLRFAGAAPDLRHLVLSTCAALTAEAIEVPLGEGCDPAEQNLYEYAPGSGLSLVNLLPGETSGTPGAALAAQSAAVSEDGSRIYFTDEGALYLREGAETKLVGLGAGFQTASTDGSVAFYAAAEHLYRYEAGGPGASTDLTPGGEVKGVLGASSAGDVVYYQDGAGLQRWHAGTTTTVAAGSEAAAESDWPPANGTARVSADGSRLLFLSTESEALVGYDNTDLNTGQPDMEVFLYDSTATQPLTCVSCNPTNERPIGSSTIPGSVPNGTTPLSTDAYKPRVLSAGGKRVFFDSGDALGLADTNRQSSSGAGIPDVYQWEAQGEGSCTRPGGCVALISSGRSPGGARFVDAAADGSDVFFLTDDSLVGADPGAVDLYDARTGGGFVEPPNPIPCQGDDCQSLPPEPTDPTLTTLLSGHGNPPVKYARHCSHGRVKRHGKCVRRHKKRHGHRRGSR